MNFKILFAIPFTIYFVCWHRFYKRLVIVRKVFVPECDLPYKWKLI